CCAAAAAPPPTARRCGCCTTWNACRARHTRWPPRSGGPCNGWDKCADSGRGARRALPRARGGAGSPGESLVEWVGQSLADAYHRSSQDFVHRRTSSSGGFLAPPSSHRSEEHTSELQSRENLVCRLLLEKKKKDKDKI